MEKENKENKKECIPVKIVHNVGAGDTKEIKVKVGTTIGTLLKELKIDPASNTVRYTPPQGVSKISVGDQEIEKNARISITPKRIEGAQ